MKKLILSIGILAVAICANAQGMRMMGGLQNSPLMLLQRADVQEDLALTDDQKDKLAPYSDQNMMRDKFMQAFQSSGMSFEDMRTEEGRKKMEPIMTKMMSDLTKEIEAILTPTQSARVKEISIQFYGSKVIMSNKDIQKALTITEEQLTKFAALQKAQGDATRGLMEKMRNQELTMDEFREKQKKNDEVMSVEIDKVLTAAQKAKFAEMGGKKFVRKDDQF